MAKEDNSNIQDLELKGEAAANKLRIFLTIVFFLATTIGYFGGSLDKTVGYYLTGDALYLLSLLISATLLRLGRMTPGVKYWLALLEVGALFAVMYSALLDEHPINRVQAVENHFLYGVYYLYVGASALRFSARFTYYTGMLCILSYIALFILTASDPQIKFQASGEVAPGTPGILLISLIVGILFLGAMVQVSVMGLKFFKQLLTQTQEAENRSTAHLTNLGILMGETNRAVTDVNKSADNLKEVSVQNEDLSQEQLASIEETSSTMEEMSASIDSIATQAKKQDELCLKNADSLNRLKTIIEKFQELGKTASVEGEQTLLHAREGETQLSQAVQGIERIQRGSHQIEEIVTVINDISDRTNLLALNAAIEAARAGAEGRGFSVVADEVSKLADMSSKNASEIEKLIKANRQDTDQGVLFINNTLKALENIIAGIKSMVEIIEENRILTENQKEASQEVLKDTAQIQSMSRDMKDSTQELLNGANEILTAITSINTSAEKFSRSSETLRESTFQIAEITTRMKNNISAVNLEQADGTAEEDPAFAEIRD